MDPIHSCELQASSSARRRFLNGILFGGTLALLGAILYPVLRFVLPPRRSEAMTACAVAGQLGELEPGSGKIFRFGNRPGLLIHTPGGEYRAFLAACPHLNCTVQYREDRAQIWCACHNGFFDLKGNRISGPPPRGLEEFQVDLRDEDIMVTRREQNA